MGAASFGGSFSESPCPIMRCSPKYTGEKGERTLSMITSAHSEEAMISKTGFYLAERYDGIKGRPRYLISEEAEEI